MPKHGRRPFPTSERLQKTVGVQAHRLGDASKSIQSTPFGIPQADSTGKIDSSFIPAGGGAAPVDAEYLVGAPNATLTQERVVTDTTTLTWDLSVAGQAKGNVPANTVDPADHAASHQNGGADEISVAGLSGLLADNQTPATHDIITKHNGFPGGGTTFLRDDGTFAAPPGGGTHDILSATHTDSTAAAVSRGSLIVGDATPKWTELVIGAANRVLRSDGTDAVWLQVAAGTDISGQLPIANGGTGQSAKTAAFDALSPVTTRGDIIVRDASNNVRLGIGTVGFVTTSDGTDVGWRKNYGTTVYVPTTADVAINNVSDQTIATRDVASVAAGDTVIIEGEFIILNNSTATRVYVITVDFDNAFDIEISTGALATSSTLMHPFTFRASCTIRSTSLAYGVVRIDGQLAAGIAAGGDTTMAATHLSGKGWGTSTSDLTGTLTCNLKIRSADATATQTCRLVCFEVRRLTPGTPLGA